MKRLKNLPIWVLWKKERIETTGVESNKAPQYTKIPYQTNGMKASSTNPDQWTTFDEVQKVKENFSGVGFTISKKYPLLCIDLDHCIKDGTIFREDLEILVSSCNTYTEFSPSGEGLHIILALEEHFPLIANKKTNLDGTAIEVYTENRYFTYTGNSYKEQKEIRKVSKEEAEELIRMVGYPWGKKIEQTVPAEHQVYTMPNKALLEKMFKSKGGAKLKRLYEGNIKEYHDDESAADAALCTSLAFWTNKNAAQIEDIWIHSPLGQREKTQNRKDYRDRTIQATIGMVGKTYTGNQSGNIVKENAPIVPTFIHEIILDGENSNKGLPHKNLVNVGKVLKGDAYLAKAFRYNTFSQIIETNIENGSDWVPFEPSHALAITQYIQRTYNYFEGLVAYTVADSITLYAKENKVNPPVDFILSEKWDGIPRIDIWLEKTFEVHIVDKILCRSIAANWMKGLVNRICTPGCQFDTVLVLEGEQGGGKSSAIRALAAPWHAETSLDVDEKDFQLILTQNIVVEFSEGATLSRSDMSNMKTMITKREDNLRRPYERNVNKFLRRCVFAMTTNQDQYLKDETGNRRWLPVHVLNKKEKPANVEWIIENRQQLFAEAYYRVYDLKETTYEFPQEELEAAQEKRMEDDPWTTAIIAWYFDTCTEQQKSDGVTTVDAYNSALWDLAKKDITQGTSQKVAGIFKNRLKLDRKQKMRNSILSWRYFSTPETEKLARIRNENLTQTERTEKNTREARKFYENPTVIVVDEADKGF